MKANRYTSPEVQNDIIKVMANHILRDVSSKLQSSSFLTVMMDETTDISNQEQVTIVMRRIDENFVASEEFLGLYTVSKIDASTLFTVIKDVMIRFNLPLSKLRGQCYNGCSTMSGSKSGVAKRIMDEEPRAVFTHCYCHSLNLAAGDLVKKSRLLKAALETTYEITKLIKKSPRRDAIFKGLKEEDSDDSPCIKLLCPTRWTVRADSLHSIISNYSLLMSTWMEAIEAARDTETKARIQGVQSQMNTFNFLFGALLGELVLWHTDNLSRTLQNEFSAAEGQHTASLVADTLETLRNDESFDLFWAKVGRLSDQFDLEPQLPRKRRAPKRYETGLAEAEFHEDPKSYYRQHYYEAFDLVINCIKERFDQPGYEVYCKLEKLQQLRIRT